MRITVLAIGSRGDIQPLLALAVGLQKTGRHKVRFAAPDNFASLVGEYDLDFFPLGVDALKVLEKEDTVAGMESGQNTLVWVWQILRSMRPTFEKITKNIWLSCQDAEFIVYSTMGFGAYHVAEKLGIPCAMGSPMPGLAPTRAYPSPGGVFLSLPLGGDYNLLTHELSAQLFQALTGRYINRWRREELDLPAIPFGKYPYHQMNGLPQPVLGSYSPIVVPTPPDWSEHIHVAGYWFLDPASAWQPPAELVDFLEAGAPPVYIGFGSMANRTPQQTTQLVQEALELSGQRGVLATGWGGLSRANLPANLFILDTVPHAWLFPRMAAVVHHGGSGTTGAGLRAGVPSVLVPHMGDQPFWAKRVTELGVGPQSIPRRKLTAERLAAAITRAVTDQDMQTRTIALGERVRAEDGIVQAIEIIEGFNR